MTTKIKVSEDGLEIIPPRDVLAQGSENTLALAFDFLGAWQECDSVQAIFSDGIDSALADVIGGAAIIPAEALQNVWRFVSIALTGTTPAGIITTPFVRLGQVLPSGYGGEGSRFVTLAQLQEILADYVVQEDLQEYITQETLDAALRAYITAQAVAEEYATKQELQDGLSGKADKTALADYATTAALTAAQTALAADIATKADASALADYETTAHAAETYAQKTELSAYETSAHAAETYVTKNDISGTVKSLRRYDFLVQGGAAAEIKTITPDANGVLDFGSAARSGVTLGRGNLATWIVCDIMQEGLANATLYLREGKPAGDILPSEAYLSVNFTDAESNTLSSSFPSVEMLTGALANYATSAQLTAAQTVLQTNINAKASADDVAALTRSVSQNTTAIADNTAAIAGKASAEDLQALETTVAGKANTSALAGYETTAHAAETFATKDDIQGMATQTWVQEYIAALDGTNMQF